MKWKRAAKRWRGSVNRLANQGSESAAAAIADGCSVVTRAAAAVSRRMTGTPDGIASIIARVQGARMPREWSHAVELCQGLLARVSGAGQSSDPAVHRADTPMRSGAASGKRRIATISAASANAPDDLSRAAESAEVAMARQDWPAAIEHWQRLLERFGDEAPASAYAGLSRAYRALPSLTQARNVVARGLGKHPGNLPCMLESAELAMAEGTWPEAVSHWQFVLDRCPNGRPLLGVPTEPGQAATPWQRLLEGFGAMAPDSAYAELAAWCRSVSRLQEAEALIAQGVEKYPDSIPCITEYAEVAVRRRDWSEAAKRWENLIGRGERRARAAEHVKLSASYRALSRFADAEAAVSRGLERYPENTPCMVEYAEIAMARRDWPEAVKRWKNLLERAGGDAPAIAYTRLAASHRALSELAEAEDIITNGVTRYPDSAPCLTQYAEIATERKDWSEALDRWQRVMDCHLANNPDSVRAIVGETTSRLKQDHRDQFIEFVRYLPANWEPTTAALCAKLHESYTALSAKDAERAIRSFEQVLGTIAGPFPRETWLSSFGKLARFYCDAPSLDRDGGRARPLRRSQASQSPVSAPVKLCVAGTGWSGSGAIYDYFKEFRDVAPTDRLGELQYVEGKYGFGHMSEYRNFKGYLFNLYATTLLGLPRLEDLRGTPHLKAAKRARTLTFGPNAHPVAQAVDTLTGELIAARKERKDRRQEHYDRATSEFIDKILLLETRESAGYILVDNFIHCKNVRMIDSLSNVRYFASLRDPRSQYVATAYERSKDPVSLSRFIAGYRASTESFNRDKNLLRGTSNAVHVVQFERFVLDEVYRDELATSVGLDLERRDKYRYFRPWQSKKNVFIHETYPKQDEIRAIEAQLPEYCLDLHQLREVGGQLQ